MGSGLIWASVGKSISDVGSMMFKSAAEERENERALQRAEALERLKESMIEERSQRDAAKAIEISQRAQAIGQERQGKAFDALAESSALAGEQGDMPVSKEQLQSLVSSTPQLGKQYRDMGLVEANLPLNRNEARLQAADDQIQAAQELGASSTLLKSYQDVKKSVLDEIKEENRDRRAADAEEGRDRRAAAAEDRRSREFREMFPLRERQVAASETRAGAAVISANRPSSTGRAGGVSRMSEVKLNQEAETLRKAAKDASNMDARRDYEARLKEVMDEIAARRKAGSATSAPKTGNNTGSRPPLDSFLKR